MATTYLELLDELLRLEDDQGFFDVTVDGVPCWDLIRPHVLSALYARLVGAAAPLPHVPPPLKTRLSASLHGLWPARNPWLMPRREVLFWGHARRQRLDDGLYWDLYMDPLIDQAPLPVNYLEEPLGPTHLQPAKTPELHYGDSLLQLGNVGALLAGVAGGSQLADEGLRRLEHSFNQHFDTRIGIAALALSSARLFRALRAACRLLLRRTRPRVLVMVTAYCYKWLVAAARDLDIPVVEVQHGYAGKLHMGYSYRRYATHNRILPDHFFSWGRFWNPGLTGLVPAERAHAVGFAHFHNCRRRHPSRQARGAGPLRLLVISQGPEITLQLSKIVAELARDRAAVAVTFRLHPSADRDWTTLYPHLQGGAVTVQDGRSTTLYQSFTESDAVAGVCSTSLFESVGWGLPTFVHRAPAYEYMLPLLERRLAFGFDDAAGLRALVETATPPGSDATDELFGRAPVETFWKTLAAVAPL